MLRYKIRFFFVFFPLFLFSTLTVNSVWWNYSTCREVHFHSIHCGEVPCLKISGSCHLQECDPEKPNDNICWGTKTCKKWDTWDHLLYICDGAPASWFCNGSSQSLPNGDVFISNVNCSLSGSFQNCTEVSSACYSDDCGSNCTDWEEYRCWVIRCDPDDQEI